jgi:hypothetical protein
MAPASRARRSGGPDWEDLLAMVADTEKRIGTTLTITLYPGIRKKGKARDWWVIVETREREPGKPWKPVLAASGTFPNPNHRTLEGMIWRLLYEVAERREASWAETPIQAALALD